MKQMVKGILSLTMLLSFALAQADCASTSCSTTACSFGGPNFIPRSQSVDAAGELVGWQTKINLFDMEELYGAFTVRPEYTRSFKPEHITGFFFGDDIQDGKLVISGSQSVPAARNAHDWLADNFGLPTDFRSEVTFKPLVQNFMIDMDLYLGLDELYEGLFFRIHAPVVYTKWEMKAGETVTAAGANAFAAGYMDSAGFTAASLLKKDFLSVMAGGHTFGDMKTALSHGKIAACKLDKWRLSDVEAAFGWNFLLDEDYHMGVSVRGSAPTGNKLTGEYLFEPIVGSTGFWKLGGNLTGHAVLWTNDEETSKFSAYLEANVSHLFERNLVRSFDLTTAGANSRYMLVSEFKTPAVNLYAGATATTAGTAPTYQYNSNLRHLVDLTTFCTDVRVDIEADVAVKLAYEYKNWEFDLGYNFWARSGEKFDADCTSCTTVFEDNKYGIKGDAMIYGFAATDRQDTTIAVGANVALSASESKATIHAGTNTPVGTTYDVTQLQNPNIDNAQFASYVSTAEARDLLQYVAGQARAAARDIKTSYQPVLLTKADLNMADRDSAMSHKVFGNVSYTWKDDAEQDEWVPFVGLGGFAEFAGKSDDAYGTLSQWGVFVKGGLSFN